MNKPPNTTVLQLCSDFARQSLYARLFRHLDSHDVSQSVFAAVRTAEEANWRPNPWPPGIDCRLEHVLRPMHRILFRRKVSTVLESLQSNVEIESLGCVHAHFLYSDGAVALRLKQTFGLPFLTAVRNTDLNTFRRYRPDLRRLETRVLDAASLVVCLSPAYKRLLLDGLRQPLRGRVESKVAVIPNGLGSDWLAEPGVAGHGGDELRLLYVGDFSSNKNIDALLRAASRVAAERRLTLTLVGGGGDAEEGIRRMLESGEYPFASFPGRVNDPEKLRDIYRRHDILVMPSFTETFGIVYIEALSQGLPVIHSSGQGVDGFFAPSTVSEAVDPHDTNDIAEKIRAVSARREDVRTMCIEVAQDFDWDRIAARYADIYVHLFETGRA